MTEQVKVSVRDFIEHCWEAIFTSQYHSSPLKSGNIITREGFEVLYKYVGNNLPQPNVSVVPRDIFKARLEELDYKIIDIIPHYRLILFHG